MKKFQKIKANLFYRKFILYFALSLLVHGAIIAFGKFVLNEQLHTLFTRYMAGTEFNVYDVFYAQISTTFILISIISLLSTNTQKVYWDDMMHRKLIKPAILNFTSLTAYLLVSLLVSTCFFIIGSNYILISFGISIVVMSVFTVKMVGAYFGRDAVKEEMKEEFFKLDKDAQEEYRRIITELSMTAIDNNEMSVLAENLELLLPNIALSDEDIDIYTKAIINKIVKERNAYAMFIVLNQNRSLWNNPMEPFYQYFCNLHSWEGGFYYQRVLLDTCFKQNVLKGNMKDQTIGLLASVFNCLQIMYIEMSKEFGIENAMDILVMLKNWIRQISEEKRILSRKEIGEIQSGKPEQDKIYFDGLAVAELMMQIEEEGGLHILREMVSNYYKLENRKPDTLLAMIYMYSYIVSLLQLNNSRNNTGRINDYILDYLKRSIDELYIDLEHMGR